MSLTGRIRGWLKGVPPVPRGPELSQRDKRTALIEALQENRFGDLKGILGSKDPHKHGALFIAVDYMLHSGQADKLGLLEGLANPSDVMAYKAWRALTAYYQGDAGGVDRLYALRGDPEVNGGQRESGPAWAIFARSRRFDPDAAQGPGPAIMQFWDKPDVPEDLQELMRAWKDLAGNRYRLFDAEMASDYLRDAYGAEDAATFEDCAHPAIQSDYFRLGYIAREGGMYLDADARMRPGFQAVWRAMGGRNVLWFRTHVPRGLFNNGILVAKPGMRLLQEAFVESGRRLRETPEAHVLSLAGPVTLRHVLVRLDERGELDPIETMTSTFAKTRVFGQAHASYKDDNRDWKSWQRKGRPS